ncbi:MAG: MurR/RpiR family transcriptional regulator [Syntrophobacterales bacterium]|jgi:DNA-binding MurR/RpiR family transcriptional regulator|nr:MurR/RpiR family transcriptional regulator [Syntrophobacterales bacterium]
MEIMSPDTSSRDPQTGTLIRLRGLYPSLKTALQKVADVILRQPEMAIYASVNEVAAVAHVSEATVMRFCRILGFKGFQDFKIALAREMVIPSTRFHEEVSHEGDGALISKVFQTNTAALQDTLEILEIEAIEAAVQLLTNSRQVLVIGVSGSGPAVAYAGNRFLLLGIKAFMYTDFYLMLMAASLLSQDDVVLAISNSGTTREIVETVRVAQEKGARVMCITNNSLSPLARICAPALVTASREMSLPEEAVASLVCQITILDALSASMSQSLSAQAQETLAKMEKAMVKVGVMREPTK